MAVAQVNREELAWAAGFFDGEGSTCLHNQTYVKITITQAGVDVPQVLTRFQAAIAPVKSTIYGPNDSAPLGKVPTWRLQITSFEMVQATVARLWPWLSSPKKDQILRAFNGANYQDSTRCRRGHLLAESGGRDAQGRCRECRGDGRENRQQNARRALAIAQ